MLCWAIVRYSAAGAFPAMCLVAWNDMVTGLKLDHSLTSAVMHHSILYCLCSRDFRVQLAKSVLPSLHLPRWRKTLCPGFVGMASPVQGLISWPKASQVKLSIQWNPASGRADMLASGTRAWTPKQDESKLARLHFGSSGWSPCGVSLLVHVLAYDPVKARTKPR